MFADHLGIVGFDPSFSRLVTFHKDDQGLNALRQIRVWDVSDAEATAAEVPSEQALYYYDEPKLDLGVDGSSIDRLFPAPLRKVSLDPDDGDPIALGPEPGSIIAVKCGPSKTDEFVNADDVTTVSLIGLDSGEHRRDICKIKGAASMAVCPSGKRLYAVRWDGKNTLLD